MAGRSAVVLTLLLGASACAPAPHSDGGRGAAQPRIAFLARSSGFWQAWVTGADGQGARQVTHSASEKCRITWYPDGRSLLVNTQEGELFRVDVETGVESAIRLQVRGMVDAAVSPLGDRVAFSLTQSDSVDANELWVSDLDGQNLRELTNREGLQQFPEWSPDGARIYYLSSIGPRSSHDIWRIGADGSSDERVTFGELRFLDVAVSRRGELAYSGNQLGGYDIWLKPAAGAPVRLTEDAAPETHPSFSPAGETLAFESSQGGVTNIWTVARAGGAAKQITFLAAPGARLPVWSVQ